jgi:hypothetical protein
VPVSASVGVGLTRAGLGLGDAIATADRGVNTNKEPRGMRRASADPAIAGVTPPASW